MSDRTPPWLPGAFVLERDPLRIVYIVAQDDDRLDEVSPFQGFGASWPMTLWALRFLAIAPASILERMWPLDGLIAQRMGGQHLLTWLPLSISALEQLGADEIGLTIVALSGELEVADRVEAWIDKQPGRCSTSARVNFGPTRRRASIATLPCGNMSAQSWRTTAAS